MSKAVDKTRKGKRLKAELLPPDDPIYSLGYVVGQRRSISSSRTDSESSQMNKRRALVGPTRLEDGVIARVSGVQDPNGGWVEGEFRKELWDPEKGSWVDAGNKVSLEEIVKGAGAEDPEYPPMI